MRRRAPGAKRGVLIAAALAAMVVPAFGIDDADLARRQADQRRAREMTREMVSAVLDLQIRQLEENGLTDLPVYRDIRVMRGNLAGLIDTEMASVVERLVEAQQASGGERDRMFVEARRAARNVVVRLSVERQSLLRRLKAAEIAEQVRRLVELQTAVRDATEGLAGLSDDRRAEGALRTLEDQRDVRELFGRLVDTLDEVKTWDGPVSLAASDGLRSLKAADAVGHLDAAGRSLAAASFGEAKGHQDAFLETLLALLSAIERTERPPGSGREALAETVEKILERQRALQEQVQREGLTGPADPTAVESQQQISASLADLAAELAQDDTAEPLRAQAEAAAGSAAEAMFLAEEDRTLAEQRRVIDRLSSLVEALETPSDEGRDRSAAEFTELAQKLESTRAALAEAVAKHSEAERSVAENPQAASAAETTAAERTTAIETQDLPPAVASRLADAAESARAAAEALAAASKGTSETIEAAEQSLAEARDAFQRAQAAVEESLADVKRSEAAVRIGELARAAEALERAAAAERQLASEAIRASEADGLAPERVAAMRKIQDDVSDVARKTTEGVQAAAPDAAKSLDRAVETSKLTQEALSQAAAAPDASSKQAAQQTAQHAEATATALTNAAAELRSEIKETAGELATLAQEQQEPVAAAQDAVAKAAKAIETNPKTAADTTRQAAETSAMAETGATAAAQAAEKALSQKNAAQDATEALDRAAISLAAREQRLARDGHLAERLGQLAGRQQTAVEKIEEARQSLAEAPSDPAAMTPQQRQAAESLHAATRQFAAVQRATGQGAVQVSGQQQVANRAIREALEAAERLPIPQLRGRSSQDGTEVAQGQGAQQPSPQGKPGESAKPGDQAASEASAEGESAAAQAGEGTASDTPTPPGGTPQATGLGKGLVPAAPNETARMIAGPDAQATLAAMDALQGTESMEDVAASETELLPEGDLPPEAEPGAENPEGQTASTAPSPDAGPAGEGTQTPDADARDADAGAGRGADAGWFAKLPPDVRAAIRASSSQPAPKAYEGRLRRYFESVEE